jgi:hypothetical protein
MKTQVQKRMWIITLLLCAGLALACLGTSTATATVIPTLAGEQGNISNNDSLPVTGGGATAVGQSVTGEITSFFEAHNWAFDGKAGQTVTIDVEGLNGMDPRIQLLDPAGKVLAENDDVGDSVNAQIIYMLPADGIYTIRLDAFTVGKYRLTIK